MLWILKHTIPSFLPTPQPTPLSYKHSILQSSTFLKSCSAPSSPLFLVGTFFVNFIHSTIFLNLAGIDNEDNDSDSAFHIIYDKSVVHLIFLQILLHNQQYVYNDDVQLNVNNAGVYANSYNNSSITDVNLIILLDACFHIIEYGGVLVLILLQISLLHNNSP